MHRFFARLVPLAVLVLVMSGCGEGETPTEPEPPATVLETFPATEPGTLTLNGAFSFPFTVTVGGSMEAVLTQLDAGHHQSRRARDGDLERERLPGRARHR